MFKYRPRAIKYTNHELTILIKKVYASGMKPKGISKLFNVSKQRINYCIHHSTIIRKNREPINQK